MSGAPGPTLSFRYHIPVSGSNTPLVLTGVGVSTGGTTAGGGVWTGGVSTGGSHTVRVWVAAALAAPSLSRATTTIVYVPALRKMCLTARSRGPLTGSTDPSPQSIS